MVDAVLVVYFIHFALDVVDTTAPGDDADFKCVVKFIENLQESLAPAPTSDTIVK